MSLDTITEVVSHFIGSFKLNAEEAPLRFAYEDFNAEATDTQDQGPLQNVDVAVVSPHEFKSYQPGVKYDPSFPVIEKRAVESEVDYNPQYIAIEEFYPSSPALGSATNFARGATLDSAPSLIPPDPPGSVATLTVQTNNLTDDDFLWSSELGQDYFKTQNMLNEIQPLIELADKNGPLPTLERPENEEAIGNLVDQIEAIAKSLQESSPGGLVAAGESVVGYHVNGAAVDALPTLQDHLPNQPEEQETEDAATEVPVTSVLGEGPVSFSTSIVIEAGGNTLVNQANVTNVWTLSPVVSVAGDSTSIDFISQVSVTQDVDSILGGSVLDDPNITATEVFNVASLTRPTSENLPNEAGTAAPTFPEFWTVTRLDTNLTVLNWIEQMNFVSDSDAMVFSSSGSEVELGSGDNVALNGFSLLELGYSFDLIVIGGSYYSANVISQTNILLDDDSVEIIGSGAGASNGTISTSDNLLWNEASITATGSINFEEMPSHYLALHEGLSSGSDDVSNLVLGDAAFGGLMGLRVLYIEGDFYDLQYIKQTNILGDSDQIALLTDKLSDSAGDQWSIEAGANALINSASIVDVIPDTTVYVGGEQYSDALLYQADLMPNTDGTETDDTGTLLTEAVLFLADGMLDEEAITDGDCNTFAGPNDTTSQDVIQTMLS